MRIGELMTKSLETIEADAPLRAAAERMRSYGIGALPVMDGGQLVGMLTDRDISETKAIRDAVEEFVVHHYGAAH